MAQIAVTKRTEYNNSVLAQHYVVCRLFGCGGGLEESRDCRGMEWLARLWAAAAAGGGAAERETR